MGMLSNLKDLESVILSKDVLRRGYNAEREVEVVPRIRRPFGCSPIGPLSWMAIQSFDLIIETCEEMIATRDHLDFGHQTMRRLRLELKSILGLDSKAQNKARKKKNRTQERSTDEEDDDDELRKGRKSARSRARHIFELLIFPYRHSHWHIWLCPIGPYIVDELSADSMINVQYAVCWADIVYLFHCKNYHRRFCDVYHTIMEYMRAGVNVLIDPDDSWLTYMRYMHVFSSIYIHIQVMERYNARIGGNWDDVIDTMRNIQRDLHREWEMDSIEIGLMAEQFSVENIRAMTGCGKGLSQVFGRRQGSLL
jgi:hypothetical protein